MLGLPAVGFALHHTVTNATSSPVADARHVEDVGIERFGRLSYSEMAHPDGTWLRGQGTNKGAHTVDEKSVPGTKIGLNDSVFGIASIGDFTNDVVTGLLTDTIAEIIVYYIKRDLVVEDYFIKPHYDFKATACPGRVANFIPTIEAKVAAIMTPPDLPPPPLDYVDKRQNNRITANAERGIENRQRIKALEADVADLRASLLAALEEDA
ncbi:MAG: hypothetical protein ACR2NL_08455, partial [Acidimicrobiia bacterium]